MPVDETWLLLFDGECETCRNFAARIERFDTDNAITVLSLQEHYRTDTTIPLKRLKEEVHLLGSRGAVLTGGDALAKVISLVPSSKPFRWMIDTRVGRKGSDVVYRIMNRMRRCRSCGDSKF